MGIKVIIPKYKNIAKDYLRLPNEKGIIVTIRYGEIVEGEYWGQYKTYFERVN